MSYAVESKKRKFHRVLESISKPLATDNASKKPTAGPSSAAEDRLPASLSIKKIRLSSNDTSDFAAVRNSILKTSQSANRTASLSSTTRPTFVPWDRERFLERLETFRRVDRWTSKPAPINEVQWAKRGWICTDAMRVSCISGCGGSVVVKLPDEIDELDGFDMEKVQERKEVRAKLVEEYQKQITEGHGENCPWRKRGCDATIQHLPLTNPETAISGLRSRYLHLAEMGDKLPSYESIQTPDGFDLDTLMKSLPSDWLKESKQASGTLNPPPEGGEGTNETTPPPAAESPQLINHAALAMAFFGWDSTLDGSKDLAACRACFRRLGLWMYKPKENGDITVYTSLDAATEHMDYCPWIDRLAQSGTGKANEKIDNLRSGWEIVAEAVKVKHRRRVRSVASVDTLRTEPSTPSAEPPSEAGTGDEETKKAADREWWAKIRRMKHVLTHKSPRRKPDHPK
ncbi:NIPA-like protein [Penicillium rolfsii]|nr:NIPA-like protein [Penicillium rolfsii]